MATGSTLTKYTSAVTIITADVSNSWFGGLHGSSEASLLDSNDPRVIGHIHDGQHIDGHAGKINLVNHVEGQLINSNLADDSVTVRNITGFTNQSDAIPVSEVIGGTEYFYLDLSSSGGTDLQGAYDAGGSIVIGAADAAVSIQSSNPSDNALEVQNNGTGTALLCRTTTAPAAAFSNLENAGANRAFLANGTGTAASLGGTAAGFFSRDWTAAQSDQAVVFIENLNATDDQPALKVDQASAASAAEFNGSVVVNGSFGATGTAMSLTASNDIDFVVGNDTADTVTFSAGGLGTFASFTRDASTNFHTLVLSGAGTTGAAISGERLFLGSTDSSEGLITAVHTSNDAAFAMFDMDLSSLATPTTTQRYLNFKASGATVGWISGDGAGNVLYQTFTGGHSGRLANPADTRSYERGMIVRSSGDVTDDFAPKVILADTESDTRVMGVFIQKVDSDEDGEFDIHYAALGDGTILVSDKAGAILNGDLIESSSVPGYGQKQSSTIFKSSTVAKCTQDIDWASVTDYVNGYKVARVACTYHCG